MFRRVETPQSPISRSASHAGDWYSDDARVLDSELTKWLEGVKSEEISFPVQGCKAIIAPHAGYSYSGSTAAWAYRSIDIDRMCAHFPTSSPHNLDKLICKRVFVLGPLHHIYLEGCALSTCHEYETPLGNLPLDLETIKELRATGKFEDLTLGADEDEHSIEMHLPYIRKVFSGKDIKIVPIVVGATSPTLESTFGALIAPHLAREDTFCVVSSDFCHWGTRFSYTHYYPEPLPSEVPAVRLSRSVAPSPSNPIHESIRQLDHQALDLLTMPPATASSAHASFSEYLVKTKNTICGRHPIGVLLGAISWLETRHQVNPQLKWVQYKQSSPCVDIRDSSVSYASGWVRF